MSKLLRIGIVGCGAIGSSLAKTIVRGFKKEAELVALFDIDTKKSRGLSRVVSKENSLAVSGLGQLISKAQLVIEASSASISWEIVKFVLMHKRDIMIMSVGGILAHFRQLGALAKKHNVKVYIPSGAICGIDALKAARIDRIKRVILTTRKPPLSFKGVKYIESKGIRLDKVKKDTVLFLGSASEAINLFPQNINVAATLSIAGIGEDKTLVKIVASPKTTKNIHEVQIDSEAASINTRTENIAHPDNPKTSYLAVLSAVAALRQILEPIKIGT
jgi:aspartate dehydrogenase